jgi:DNA-binding NarL/FixJ family response regulator
MTETMPIRIALVDDQALVLRGLSALLHGHAGIEVALEASDGGQLLAALPQRPVDVIVSDIRMPGVDGIELISRLRATGDATPVILLTTFDDTELMRRAVAAGAQGFLLKDATPDDLAAAIHAVAAGGTLLQPVSFAAVRLPAEAAGTSPLTERETAILRLVAGGFSNKEIARTAALVRRHSEELHERYPAQTRQPRPHPGGAEGTDAALALNPLKPDGPDRQQAVLKALTRRWP